MNILKEIKITVLVTLVLLIICCGIYPVFIFGVGQLLFPEKADGSIVYDGAGKPIASTLLGQTFSADKYFNPRPSAAGNGYDSTSSGGSNLGSLSQTLHDNVKQRVADYRKANNLSDTQLVPADAVTASGSGLDPHISVKNALLQLPRVAKARGMSEADLKALMEKYTDGPDLGILGDAGVNIIKLNLALDGKYK
ncbi:MAG TPA: K(+)-transporting ATPase subunit C [Candidatus Methylacidiphilales bacterium]|jgi:K+-transporting ATPase ATPase C chain|nr:K(+)-transporting ATPase subunit C [Candidatus Methylacidiphilales bacterium]